MSQVVVGAITDQLGHASSWETIQVRHASRNFDTRRTFWACPADRFRPVQPADVPLQAGHGGPRLGSVVHIAHRSKLWVVGEVDDGYDLSRQPWQLSYDLTEKPDGLFTLNAVAVVERSATVGVPPIEVRDGTLSLAVGRVVRQDGIVETLVREAHEHSRRRKRGEPLVIEGAAAIVSPPPEIIPMDWQPLNPMPQQQRLIPPQARAGWRPGMIEWSQHAGQILSIR